MFEAALVTASAVLLLVAGVAKIRTPGPAASMLVTFWPRLHPLRRARFAARLAGVVEAGAAVAVLLTGHRLAAAALAACYLALSLVALRLATSRQRAACGCFGNADGVVGAPHVVLDLAALAVAAWAVAAPPGSVVALVDHGSVAGVIALVQALLLAGLAYLSITALPALSAARRTVEDT